MNKKFDTTNLLIGIILLFLVAVPVSAQNIGVIVGKADLETDQRIQNLNDAVARVGLTKKIPNAERNSLISSANNEINQLNALKSRIDAEVSPSMAELDYKSITGSYRIYALVLPQIRIMAASDKVMIIVDSMTAMSAKIKSRMSSITGADLLSINQILSDFTAKINDATSQAKLSESAVFGLLPDQGDNNKMQTNTNALNSAKTDIETASNDLVSARQDIGNIVAELKKIGGPGSMGARPNNNP